MAILSIFVQERAVLVGASLASKVGRAVLGRSILCSLIRSAEVTGRHYEMCLPQLAAAILGIINTRYTSGGVFFIFERHVDSYALIGVSRFRFADNNLFDGTVLTEVFLTSQCLHKTSFIFLEWFEADDIDQILLFDSNTGKILATGGFDFTFLGLFSFLGGLFLALIQLIEFEFFGGGYLVLNRGLVVRSSTVWTCRLLIGCFQTIETKLAYLIAARTRLEILVG